MFLLSQSFVLQNVIGVLLIFVFKYNLIHALKDTCLCTRNIKKSLLLGDTVCP